MWASFIWANLILLYRLYCSTSVTTNSKPHCKAQEDLLSNFTYAVYEA